MTKRHTPDSSLPDCDRELKLRKLWGDENRTISLCQYEHVMLSYKDELDILSELLRHSSQSCNGIEYHHEDCNHSCGAPINFTW